MLRRRQPTSPLNFGYADQDTFRVRSSVFRAGINRDEETMKSWQQKLIAFCIVVSFVGNVEASVITFDHNDFGLNDSFNDIRSFDFTIDLVDGLVAGQTYSNPALNSVVYNVFGVLSSPTPSGFPAFDLRRTIGGAEFYAQGSSLNFSISPVADLSDGLQVSELVGVDPVFVFNGREVGTGRYHPTLIELNSNGTGLFRNSNNFGGINPGNNMMVDVQVGEEYITGLAFDAGTLTIATTAVPEPSTWVLCTAFIGVLVLRRNRKRD